MLAQRIAHRLPFYYGWLVAFVSGLILFVAFGIRLSFSVFFVELIAEFGWSRADTSLIFSTTMIVFAATSTLAGVLLDRKGSRFTFTVGAAVLGLGLILSTQIQTLAQLTLTYGVIAGFGITILGLSMHAGLIRSWFQSNVGAAIGIAFAGTGLGSFVVTPTAESVIRNFDWRTAMWLLGGSILCMIVPIQLFLTRSPHDVVQPEHRFNGRHSLTKKMKREETTWTLIRVIQSPSFWLLLLAGVCAIAPVRTLTVHQLAMMTDQGVDSSMGARAIGVTGLVTAATFVLAGILSDRIGRIPTYFLGGFALLGAFGLALTFQAGWTVWPYAILLGIGEGSRSSLVSATAADLFAGPTLGGIIGTIGAGYGLGAAILPWLAGRLFDLSGSYSLALLIAAAVTTLSLLSLAFSWRLGRRV